MLVPECTITAAIEPCFKMYIHAFINRSMRKRRPFLPTWSNDTATIIFTKCPPSQTNNKTVDSIGRETKCKPMAQLLLMSKLDKS